MRSLLAIIVLIISALNAQATPCSNLHEALIQASRLRGLDPKREVGCIDLTRSEFDSQTRSAPLDRDVLRYEEIIFKNLGLIPDSFDYARCADTISQADALASYSPQIGSILVPDGRDTDTALLAHEIVHALQDQYFDLDKLKKHASLTTDAALATDALIEGDAVRIERLIRARYAYNPSPQPQSETSDPRCTLPEIFLAQLDLSYFFGPLFVENIKQTTPVDSLFKHPPTTTAQILHPKLYLSTKNVTPPARRSASGDLLLRDRLGEFMIRSWLKIWIASSTAIEAASGWIDDDLTLRRVNQRLLLLRWRTDWSSELERDQFWSAILLALERRTQVALKHAAPQLIVEAPGFAPFSIHRIDKSVTLEMKIIEPSGPS